MPTLERTLGWLLLSRVLVAAVFPSERDERVDVGEDSPGVLLRVATGLWFTFLGSIVLYMLIILFGAPIFELSKMHTFSPYYSAVTS